MYMKIITAQIGNKQFTDVQQLVILWMYQG